MNKQRPAHSVRAAICMTGPVEQESIFAEESFEKKERNVYTNGHLRQLVALPRVRPINIQQFRNI